MTSRTRAERLPRTRAAAAAAAAPPIVANIMAPGAISTAPLHLFDLGAHNVRTIYAQPEIDEMAADLRLRGLKQNLVAEISPAGGGRLAVVAGGRRLRALWQLADAGEISRDLEIPYMLEDASTGRETSLAENTQKVALNPVDEIRAFAQIVADHHAHPDPLLYCAQRAGTTRRHVEQQLRLAELAPDILDALREGRIDIGAARAYASSADHEAQLAVFAAEERRMFGHKHGAAAIRDTLRSRTYPETIAQAIYVGIDAYRAAGGRTDRDLFFGADEGERLLDPALLDRLARDKAIAALPARAAADGLAGGLPTAGFNLVPAWPKPPATHVQRPGVRPDQLSAEERAVAIGVYGLAADGSDIELVGLMTAIALPAPAPAPAAPLAIAAAPAPADPPPPKSPSRHPTNGYAVATDWVWGTPPPPRGGDVLARAARMNLLAARIAVEHASGGMLEGRATWPTSQGYVPAISPADDDPETMAVAVLVRVSRAELEAALPEAEAQLDAEDADALDGETLA